MSKKNAAPAAHTRIALVLDRSGSMQSIREPARDAFNEAIGRVQSDARAGAEEGLETSLSVITFNHELEDVLLNAPIANVRPLGPEDYRPDGMTALFDGVGHAIDVLEKAGPLGSRDAALVIVISDGHENSSTQVSQADLVERMQALEASGQWTFSFLMANVDITDLSRKMGTEASNYAAWDADAAGMAEASDALSVGVSSYMADRRAGKTQRRSFFESDEDAS